MIKSKLLAGLRRLLLLTAVAAGSLSAARAQQISISDVSPAAQEQIASLIAEKATRTPAQLKLDSQLLYANRMAAGQTLTDKVQSLEVLLNQDKGGRVLVDINATVDKALVKSVARMGGLVVNQFPALHAMRAWLPLSSLEAFAGQSQVLFVRPADEAETEHYTFAKADRKAARQNLKELLATLPPQTNQAGSVDTEGEATHRAAQARALTPGTAGLKIGVLSDSLDDSSGSYAKALASGDVTPVTVIPGQAGSGAGEGLAMLEIIADLCPGAQLYFATAFSGQAGFASNIRALRAAGCDVIVDDVGYFAESPFFDDVPAQAVNDVTASGAFYFSSAGNAGNQRKNSAGVWEGDFNPGGAFVPPGVTTSKTYIAHNFGTAAAPQLYDSFPANPPTGSSRLGVLNWNDSPASPSANDYDLFYLSADGTTVQAASTNVQNGSPGQTPFEIFGLNTAPFAGKRFVVVQTAGAAQRFIRLSTGRGYLTINTPGQTFGHAAAVNAFGVAATPAAASFGGGNPTVTPAPGPYPGAFGINNQVESFTSEGPRHIYFNPDGSFVGTAGDFTSAGGVFRQKPDFTAADGVTTTLPSASGLNPFYGTSAAAPHAAAIAGILLAKNPNLTRAQMSAALAGTAYDIEATGFDRVSGAGIIDALNGVNAIQPGPGKLGSGINFRVLTPDGTGVVSRGITAKVYVALSNTGGNTSLSGITGTLTTSTPNVVVRARPSTYSPLAPGKQTENDTPFILTTTSGFAPAGTIALTYTVTNGGVTTSYPFTIPTAFTASSTVSRFETTAAAQVVPDNTAAGINIPFTVSGLTNAVGKVTLSVFCDKSTYIGDLVFKLISPDGTVISLATNVGTTEASFGAGPADAQRITFDDAATATLTETTVTTGGTYKPSQPLAGFAGKNGNGTWTLNIADVGAGDVSTYEVSSLFIQQAQ